MKLRSYQDDLIAETRGHFKAGKKSVIIAAPTGSGKTILASFMAGRSAQGGTTCWFICHRRELVSQTAEAFKEAGINTGIISSGAPSTPECPVQIASVQTLIRRFTDLPKPGLIIWDECHHLAAKSWQKIYDANRECLHVGLSATPERLDGQGLGRFFEVLVRGPSVAWLIENKYLAPFKYFAPSTINVAGVRKIGGDYAKSQLTVACDKPHITGNAISEYQKYAPGAQAIVFCASIAHSQNVSHGFNSAGFAAAHVDGTTPKQERDKLVGEFRDGKINVLCNVDLFGEGFNVIGASCAILLRPTASLCLHRQQVGRILRFEPDKTAVILDHAGNHKHGLPNQEIVWQLAGRKVNKNSSSCLAVRVCPSCYAAQLPGVGCRFCGFIYPVKPKKLEMVDGELVELDTERYRVARIRERKKAHTLSDLIELGKKRGYANGWAYMVFNSRRRK